MQFVYFFLLIYLVIILIINPSNPTADKVANTYILTPNT